MYKYHVYGKVMKEFYYIGSKGFTMNTPISWMLNREWDEYCYNLNKDSEPLTIFESIKFHSNSQIINNLKHIKINVGKEFTKYKEFKIIENDIELRDGEIICIDNKDYKVVYKYNDDTKQNELYIDKVIEVLVDIEEKKYANKICKDVFDKIIKHNNNIIENETKLIEVKKNILENKEREIINKNKEEKRSNRILRKLCFWKIK